MSIQLLLATDFDGTLAPIVDDPAGAAGDPELVSLLELAAGLPAVQVAIVSGRDLDDLLTRVPIENVWYAGSHGREVRRPDGTWLDREPALSKRPTEDLAGRLRERGFTFEPKKFGLAIHWRTLSGVSEDDADIQEFEHWARAEGLEVIRGRRVAEARAGGADKRDAIEKIARELNPVRILYAGDDLTDFAALELAATRGRALFLESDERDAPDVAALELVSDRDALLKAFAEEIAPFRS